MKTYVYNFPSRREKISLCTLYTALSCQQSRPVPPSQLFRILIFPSRLYQTWAILPSIVVVISPCMRTPGGRGARHSLSPCTTQRTTTSLPPCPREELRVVHVSTRSSSRTRREQRPSVTCYHTRQERHVPRPPQVRACMVIDELSYNSCSCGRKYTRSICPSGLVFLYVFVVSVCLALCTRYFALCILAIRRTAMVLLIQQ